MMRKSIGLFISIFLGRALVSCQSHPAGGSEAPLAQENQIILTAHEKTVSRSFDPPVIVSIPSELSVQGRGATAAPLLTLIVEPFGNTIVCSYTQSAGTIAQREACTPHIPETSIVEISSAVLDPRGSAKVAAKLDIQRPSRRPRPNNNEEILDWHKNPGQGKPYPSTPFPGQITFEFRKEAAAIARIDPRVQSLLGERSAFVSLYRIDGPKDRETPPERHYNLVYFSHSNNRAVSVEMLELEVKNAEFTDIWPGSGDEEDNRAIELARKDARLPDNARNWEAGAMLASFYPEHHPAPGHRVLDVRFGPTLKRMASVAQYYALVDLTDDKVLELGKTEEQGKRRNHR